MKNALLLIFNFFPPIFCIILQYNQYLSAQKILGLEKKLESLVAKIDELSIQALPVAPLKDLGSLGVNKVGSFSNIYNIFYTDESARLVLYGISGIILSICFLYFLTNFTSSNLNLESKTNPTGTVDPTIESAIETAVNKALLNAPVQPVYVDVSLKNYSSEGVGYQTSQKSLPENFVPYSGISNVLGGVLDMALGRCKTFYPSSLDENSSESNSG